MPRLLTTLLIALCVTTACTTSSLGRKQLKLFPEGQMAQMGVQAFTEMQKQTPASKSSRENRYVNCVADSVTAVVGGEWEVTLFEDDEQINAFALPGGKIGVYTGLLKAATNQHQLATVIGHEIAHVLEGHGNERVSQGFVAQTGFQVATVLAGDPTPAKQQLLGLLGLGTQVGILLPFGRTQESESDLIGLDIMAHAGFDPREAPKLWVNMQTKAQESGQQAPPEFLSTHPSGETRIRMLNNRMPSAMNIYQQAQASGKRPNCR